MNSTKDLWFASFLTEVKKLKVINVKRLDDRKGQYFFEVPDDKWNEYKLEFNSSIISEIKYAQEKLKDLIY